MAREREYLRQSGLINQDIQNKENAKKDLENTVVSQKNQLTNTQTELAGQDSKLQAALLVLKEKEDIFKPIREESKAYFAAVDSAKQRVSEINSQITSTQTQITQIKNKIASLQTEEDNLENKIAVSQNEISSLRSERIRAQNEYFAFDVEQQLRRRLENDFTYQNLLRSKQQSDINISNYRDQVSRLEADVRDLERELRSCQSTPDRDCTSIQNEINAKKSELSTAQSSLNNELMRNRQIQQDTFARQQTLRTEVENEKDKLADRVTQLDLKINDVQTRIEQYQLRLSTIRNSELPRYERDLSTSQNSLISLQSQLDNANSNLRRAEQDLASFKARTDYTRKESEYIAADKKVRDIRAYMTSLDLQIRSLQTSIARNETKITTLANEIERLVTQLASTQQGLAAVQAELAPLMQEKASLTEKLNLAQANMKTDAEEYRVFIRDLPRTKSRMPSFPAKFWDWL